MTAESSKFAESGPGREAATLTRSIEFVMRSFVRIMIGKISLVSLIEMGRKIFVEEAEKYLERENPGKKVSLTGLSVLTGLDTRMLTQVRERKDYKRPLHEDSEFLDELTTESCVIELWTSNPRFSDLETGKPRTLDLWGEESSFETLVREAVRTRGVTVQSVANRMERDGLAEILDDKRIRLLETRFAPLDVRQNLGEIKLGLDAAGHLLGTVQTNLSGVSEYKLFQRGSWTHRLSEQNRERMSFEISGLLTQVDRDVRGWLERYEEPEHGEVQVTAGVGLYYFEAEDF